LLSARLRSASLRWIVATPLRIASPATTRLPSLMKTCLGSVLFRKFLGRTATAAALAHLKKGFIPSGLVLARGICCSAGETEQIPRFARNDKSQETGLGNLSPRSRPSPALVQGVLPRVLRRAAGSDLSGRAPRSEEHTSELQS